MGFDVSGISHSVSLDFCICSLRDPLHWELTVQTELDGSSVRCQIEPSRVPDQKFSEGILTQYHAGH